MTNIDLYLAAISSIPALSIITNLISYMLVAAVLGGAHAVYWTYAEPFFSNVAVRIETWKYELYLRVIEAQEPPTVHPVVQARAVRAQAEANLERSKKFLASKYREYNSTPITRARKARAEAEKALERSKSFLYRKLMVEGVLPVAPLDRWFNTNTNRWHWSAGPNKGRFAPAPY